MTANIGEEPHVKDLASDAISFPTVDPKACVSVIFLSTSSLPHYLTAFLRRCLSETIFLERDLSEKQEASQTEGDLILSANRCILIFTQAQITQALPSYASNQIILVALKCRYLEVLVSCPSKPKGKDISEFTGWLEQLNQEHNVRVIFAKGENEMAGWLGWLCQRRECDGMPPETHCLTEEETEVDRENPQENEGS